MALTQRISKLEKKVASQATTCPLEGHSVYQPNEADLAEALVLLVSPSLRQSGELFRKVADLLAQLDHKPELTEDNRLSLRLANGSRVISLPSKEGTIRGFSGVDLIIEDESSRVPDELYRAVRPSWRYPVADWS